MRVRHVEPVMGGLCFDTLNVACMTPDAVPSSKRDAAATDPHDMMPVGSGAPWRFGVLFSQSGVTAAVETTQLNATILAAEAVNAAGGIRGQPVELVAYDPASNPKQFHALAERLLGKDGVRLIFGCYMSSTRKAVLP